MHVARLFVLLVGAVVLTAVVMALFWQLCSPIAGYNSSVALATVGCMVLGKAVVALVYLVQQWRIGTHQD